MRQSRRQYLTLIGVTVTATSAGCLSETESEILVTNTQLYVEEDVNVVVLVTIENEKTQRQTGMVRVTLEYPPANKRWEQTDELSIARGSSPRPEFTFENVHEPGYDFQQYEVTATFEPDE